MFFWLGGSYIATDQADVAPKDITLYENEKAASNVKTIGQARSNSVWRNTGPWSIVTLENGVPESKKSGFPNLESLLQDLSGEILCDTVCIRRYERINPADHSAYTAVAYEASKARSYNIEYNPYKDRRWFKPKTELLINHIENQLKEMLAKHPEYQKEINILVVSPEEKREKSAVTIARVRQSQ
uniref:Uncharacterized protein n=1 Tax=Cyanothece sp. (strain PCC 7425 / ATCC 29141) TaxID=395961 RepID=B8HJK5_CYAP4